MLSFSVSCWPITQELVLLSEFLGVAKVRAVSKILTLEDVLLTCRRPQDIVKLISP